MCACLDPPHLRIGSWLPPPLQTAVAASRPAPCPCVTLHRAAFRTEGSLLRWEPQPHAAAPCTPYTSLLGASFKPDMAGRACILSGNRVAKVQTTSRGRVAMGLFWKSKKQKASRSRAPGHHATPRHRASSTLRSKHRRRSTRGCWLRLYITHVTIGDA